MSDKKIVMSGMRPTGRLTLGNYWGALQNWLKLQDEYQCYFSVADWHMLTTGYEKTGHLQTDVREMVLDWLAAGLDPDKCVIFQQSRVPQHAELTLLLSMITPISWLENNPTYKEQLQELAKTKLSQALDDPAVLDKKMREKLGGVALEELEPHKGAKKFELRTQGFLGYPVMQTADIAAYGAHLVPVGQDQLPHIEISREIVRKFNSIYGPVLIEPKGLVTQTPKLPGIDGRKMSKSYGNGIELAEDAAGLKSKVMSMYTDPTKIRKDDPGHPEPCAENPPGCVVFALHKLYGDALEQREADCRTGAMGCVACKKDLLGSMTPQFDSFLEKRESFAKDGVVDGVLEAGNKKAAEAAEATLEKVRKAMNLRG